MIDSPVAMQHLGYHMRDDPALLQHRNSKVPIIWLEYKAEVSVCARGNHLSAMITCLRAAERSPPHHRSTPIPLLPCKRAHKLVVLHRLMSLRVGACWRSALPGQRAARPALIHQSAFITCSRVCRMPLTNRLRRGGGSFRLHAGAPIRAALPPLGRPCPLRQAAQTRAPLMPPTSRAEKCLEKDGHKTSVTVCAVLLRATPRGEEENRALDVDARIENRKS